MLSAGTSILSGFASGGPVGGAIAATSAAVGLLVNAFGEAGKAAEDAANRATENWTRSAENIRRAQGGVVSQQEDVASRQEQARRAIAIDRQVAAGMSRDVAQAAYDEAAARQKVADALKDAEYSLAALRRSARREETFTPQEREAGLLKAQQDALVAAQQRVEAARILRDQTESLLDLEKQRAIWSGVAKADEEARKRQAAEAAAVEKAAKDTLFQRSKAQGEMNQALREQVKTMLDSVGLTKEELDLQKMIRDEEMLRLSGSTDLANRLREYISIRYLEIQALKQAAEEKKKGEAAEGKATEKTKEHKDELTKAKDAAKGLKDALQQASQVDLASPIRAAAQAMKTLRAPGRGGAQFDEEGNFLGLGLAAAREERRSALRTRKRRRAEFGRMGSPIEESVNLRSGRRAGGLGAFSAFEGGTADGIGVREREKQTKVSASFFSDQDVAQMLKATAENQAAAGKSATAGATAAQGLNESTKALAGELQKQTSAIEAAKTSSSDAAASGQRAAEGLRLVSENIRAAADSLRGMADTVTQLKSDVNRLKEAARLRGGN